MCQLMTSCGYLEELFNTTQEEYIGFGLCPSKS
ncbi:hypothetical protein Goari_005836 [Gossypium aridum]|uniref:Uncharacterized protein n=1 Tax=Gossypium aridum TaxID=34290 RepID=A0A7J8XL95_GOSAI|nr:hypothetical protein [Gossypium aridum]